MNYPLEVPQTGKTIIHHRKGVANYHMSGEIATIWRVLKPIAKKMESSRARSAISLHARELSCE